MGPRRLSTEDALLAVREVRSNDYKPWKFDPLSLQLDSYRLYLRRQQISESLDEHKYDHLRVPFEEEIETDVSYIFRKERVDVSSTEPRQEEEHSEQERQEGQEGREVAAESAGENVLEAAEGEEGAAESSEVAAEGAVAEEVAAADSEEVVDGAEGEQSAADAEAAESTEQAPVEAPIEAVEEGEDTAV